MKNRLAIALAALVLTASVAWADFNVLDKSTWYQNATNGAKTNSTGDAQIVDSNFGAWVLFPNIISNQIGVAATNMSDSSQAYATYPYRRLSLYITPQFDSLSTVVRIAVQVRAHFTTSTDSGSTFPWYRWPQKQNSNGFVTVASIVAASGNTVLHTAAAAASLGLFSSVGIGWQVSGPGIDRGTFVVSKGTSDSALTISKGTTAIVPANTSMTFWPPGALDGNASIDADSLGHMYKGTYAVSPATAANIPFSASTGMWPGEFEVKFDVARQDTADGAGGLGKFGAYPKTIYLPLQDATGAWFSAPYTSVRIRTLNGIRSRFRVKIDMTGMQ